MPYWLAKDGMPLADIALAVRYRLLSPCLEAALGPLIDLKSDGVITFAGIVIMALIFLRRPPPPAAG